MSASPQRTSLRAHNLKTLRLLDPLLFWTGITRLNSSTGLSRAPPDLVLNAVLPRPQVVQYSLACLTVSLEGKLYFLLSPFIHSLIHFIYVFIYLENEPNPTNLTSKNRLSNPLIPALLPQLHAKSLPPDQLMYHQVSLPVPHPSFSTLHPPSTPKQPQPAHPAQLTTRPRILK
jgi:hypothetical protein